MGAAAVEEGRNDQEFDRVVVAGPRMLGLIRDALPAPLKPLVAAEVGKDIVQLDEATIKTYVPREVFGKLSG